jgi:hypothetical protein
VPLVDERRHPTTHWIRRRCAANKIAPILTARFGPTAFPLHRCGAAQCWPFGRLCDVLYWDGMSFIRTTDEKIMLPLVYHLRSSICFSLILLVLGRCGRLIHSEATPPTVPSVTNSLPTAASSSSGPHMDATKQIFEQQITAPTQTAQAQPPPTSGGIPIPSTPPNILPPEIGIRWDCGGPAPHFEINNCWSEMINGHYVTVVAGAQEPDLSQGMLWVTEDQAADLGTTAYPSPTKSGPLVISAIQETRIHLKAANGDRFTFEVVTRTWGTQ